MIRFGADDEIEILQNEIAAKELAIRHLNEDKAKLAALLARQLNPAAMGLTCKGEIDVELSGRAVMKERRDRCLTSDVTDSVLLSLVGTKPWHGESMDMT